MSSRIQIENDDVIDVDGYVGQAFDGLVDNHDEPSRHPAAVCSSKIVSICLATRRFTRQGQQVMGGLSGRTEMSTNRREHHRKSAHDLETTSTNSMKVSPSCFILGGSQPG